MSKRTEEIMINEEMIISQKIQPGKVVIIVLDGHLGKAKKCEAVEHGYTVIETAKGKTARIKFEESELF